MKLLIYLCLATAILAGTSACEKVITVQLDNAAPQFVIEGNINNLADTQKVVLSKSSSYFDSKPQQFFSGARVSVMDNNGNNYVFNQVSPGIYINTTLTGVPGMTYNLIVLAEGNTYTASSTMPQVVPIDSLSSSPRQRSGFGFGGGNKKPSDQIHCHFKDPANLKNYYRLDIKIRTTTDTAINNNVNNRYHLYDDRLTNGIEVDYRFNTSLQPGDSAFVQLKSIDKATYDYFNVLNGLLDQNSQDASPANPPNNIKGGALGYFSAYSVVSAKKVVR